MIETSLPAIYPVKLKPTYIGAAAATAAAKSLQPCPTLCDPIDDSPPGSPVPGILQARTLEWGCHCLLQCMKVKSESEVAQSYLTLHIRLLATPWTTAYQAPLSIGFSRQEYWSSQAFHQIRITFWCMPCK